MTHECNTGLQDEEEGVVEGGEFAGGGGDVRVQGVAVRGVHGGWYLGGGVKYKGELVYEEAKICSIRNISGP